MFHRWMRKKSKLSIFFGNEDTKTLFGVLNSRKTRCHLIGCNHWQANRANDLSKYTKCTTRISLISSSNLTDDVDNLLVNLFPGGERIMIISLLNLYIKIG